MLQFSMLESVLVSWTKNNDDNVFYLYRCGHIQFSLTVRPPNNDQILNSRPFFKLCFADSSWNSELDLDKD